MVHPRVAGLVDDGPVPRENEVGHCRHAHGEYPLAQEQLRPSTSIWDLPNVHTEIVRPRDNVLREKVHKYYKCQWCIWELIYPYFFVSCLH